jgi:hypothetical protein
MEDIRIGCRVTLMAVKLQNAESKKPRKRLGKKFKEEEEEESDSLIPDGIVNFLLQNSEVEFIDCSELPLRASDL